MIKKQDHKYPLVKVIWIDITADSNWKSLSELDKESLPVCVSVGYLYSVKNKITRLFADYSLKDNEIDEVGNTTLIPNSVILDVKSYNLALLLSCLNQTNIIYIKQ